MIAFSKFLRYDYNVYNRYAINYYYDHYNDEEIDFDGVRHAFKVKLITLTFVHLFLIVIMVIKYMIIKLTFLIQNIILIRLIFILQKKLKDILLFRNL